MVLNNCRIIVVVIGRLIKMLKKIFRGLVCIFYEFVDRVERLLLISFIICLLIRVLCFLI